VTQVTQTPLKPPVFATRPDIRLIAADMDGTLLDDNDDLNDHLWPLLDELARRKILFCPASGRQYYNLLERFHDVRDEVVFIAENGTYVVRQGREISSDCIEPEVVTRLVLAVRELRLSGVDVGVVVCGKRSAYIERRDRAFRAEVEGYYTKLQAVGDLLSTPEDEVLKVSIFDFGSAEHTTAPALARFRATHQVVVSGEHWVDIMSRTANKGEGIRHLQQSLGITRAQTMVFGDFLNDLEMMDAGQYSFAMANAHPALRSRARYVAPSNRENGVVRTIASVLGISCKS
jgi:Cof subfamily protein (haloacid dehalogenase superfamily)